MTQQSVSTDTVRAWFEAFMDDPDAFRDLLHPDIEWFPFEDNHSPSRGIGRAMRVRRHWLESWSDQVVELEDFVDNADSIVVTAHITARGRGSGVQVDARIHFHSGFGTARSSTSTST